MLKSIPNQAVYDYHKRSYIAFGIEDLNLITDYEKIMPQTKYFCENWGVSFDYVLDKLRDKHIIHKMFSFAYDIHNKSLETIYKHSQLVQENYFHTTTGQYVRGEYVPKVKDSYDVYIVEDNYVTLYLVKLIPDIIKDFYSWLYVEVPTNKFSSDLPEINTKCSVDTYTYNIEFNKLTLEDIAFICNNPNTWRDYKVNTFKFKYYSDMLCYCVDTVVTDEHKYEYCIIIPVEAIRKRDWSIVENKMVFSIRDTRPNKNKWYEGQQKDAPYWDNSEVKEIKKLFLK